MWEYTRLIDQDRFRSRAIYSWQKGELEIVEHHHETRLEDASAPIPSDRRGRFELKKQVRNRSNAAPWRILRQDS